MKTFQLTAEPRTDLGKKAAKALRQENKIPVVLNGGEIVTLPYEKALKPGEKIVEIGNGKGLITTDLVVSQDAVRRARLYSRYLRYRDLPSTVRPAWQSSRTSSSTP